MQSPSAQMAAQNNRHLIFISVVLAAVLLWLLFDYVVYATCLLLYHLWLIPWSIAPSLFTDAPAHINLLARTGNESRMVGFPEWLDVMNHSAGIIFWYLLPFIITGLVMGSRHPAMNHISRRVIDIHNLARLMVPYAPAIAPVLCYGDKKELLLNDTTPEQAPALSPEAFARKHSLIRHERLDRPAAEAVFRQQLGRPLNTIQDLQKHERVLFALFGLQVFCHDRKAAIRLRDNLNRSCLTGRRGYPIQRLADKAFSRVSNAPGVREWISTHGYVRTALTGLYGRDLHIPPATFRWLKGLDRTLWYALHTADTTAVFTEGAGVVAVARAEIAARQLGYPRPEPGFQALLDTLTRDLETFGELPSSTPVSTRPVADD